jgi:hypothetical protein
MVSERQYLRGDAHDETPPLNQANYAFEDEHLAPILLRGVSRALQVGCMNGDRVVRYSRWAEQTRIDGLEMSAALAAIAQDNVDAAGLDATIFRADVTDLGTVTSLPTARYDVVYALNNTLGFIPDTQKAMAGMRFMSKGTIALSVFGAEVFNNERALAYYTSMGFDRAAIEIDGNTFHLPDAGGARSEVRRFTREEVYTWGAQDPASRVIETPLGYCCILSAQQHTA